ncbi:MAG: histidine phosphatase family protein [Ilumatobacteraceae bacterium]|jgi:probable phosphoglycerate mutase
MEIVLVRHGEPEWVRDDLSVGNPPLTVRGTRQAERTAAALSAENFDEVWVSPLIRAQETALPYLSRTGRSPGRASTQDWLEEIRNPLWHGSPKERAEAAFAEERRRPAELRWDGLEGGEPVRDFVARIHTNAGLFFEERGVRPVPHSLPVWEIDDSDRRILLVAHAGTNSVLICHLLGLAATPWEWERFVLGHASISRLVSYEIGDGHTFGLVKLSDVEHLDRDDRTF